VSGDVPREGIMSMFAFGDKEWPGLAKLNEESGELVQVIGKLMMTHGQAKHWDGSDLRVRLVEEMADEAAAIGFVADHALMDDEILAFATRRAEKRALFEKWHEEQAEP
jgi:NTP pyrophosphatase (non-canonical NTP hydrolase)